MKFTIRIKFFVVLLAFSLGPLLLSRGIMGRAADKMTERLSDETRTELLSIVSSELQHNAIALLTILESQGQTLSIGTQMLAHQAEHHLNWETPKQPVKPYYSSDFGRPGMTPPDATFAPGYDKETMSGQTRPIKVSFDHPTVRIARRETSPTANEQIQRLQWLLPTFKEVYGGMTEAAYWLNISLESGASITYPGHGGFPMMYDHRDQDWYKNAQLATDECSWSTPEIDPATRRAVAKGSFPIRDKDGKFIGVASIDVPISAMFNDAELKSRWSGEIKSFMATRHPKVKFKNEGLLILAQQSYGEGGRRHWMAGFEPEWLTSDDPEAFKELLAAMDASPNGIMRLPYEGKPSVWAFASTPDFSFLLIAPESVVTQLPDQVAGGLDSLFDEMRDISAIISGIMLIVTGLIAWFGSRTVSKPLLVMADAAKRLAKGDFSVHLDMRTGDERDQLIDSFNDMVPKLKERMHLRRDMELAHEVQKLLLPRSTPTLSGFDISGGIAYCDDTGGDYYDFIEAKGDIGKGLGVVLGDVSGHGVPSALLMATARGQLHSLSRLNLSPKQRITTINSFLSRDMDGTGRFLTMFYLRLTEDDPRVIWVRAGHDPAVRYTPDTDEFSELSGDGLALGVLEEFEFQEYEATLTSGEVLVLATDGVWEARSADGEMFGKKRMLALVRENAHKSSEEIRRALMEAVEAYQGNGQEDDIAVVVIKKD